MNKWSLRIKILVSVGIIILVVLSTSTLVHIHDVQQDYLEALEWRSEALAQRLIKKAQELANMAPEFNSHDLLELLSYHVGDVYDSNPHLTHIAVIDTEGRIAAHHRKALWDTPIRSLVLREALQQQTQVVVLDGATYHMLFPIRNMQAVYLGSIDIGVPKHVIDEKARQILRHAIELLALFVGLAVLAASVSGHLLTKPINHLVRIAQELAEGNLAQPIVISDRGDEIGVLARSFAHMRDRIKHQIEDLQRLNDELERRVKERTAEIARQKYILDTFMATVPDSIYFKDHRSRFIRVNQALATLFGSDDPDELCGKSDFDFFPQPVARAKYEQEQAILRSGQPVLNVEEPDAQGRSSLTTKMPLRDEHGNVIGTFGISRDITELKQAEQELERYRERLEDLVDQRTAELTRTIEETKRLNARLHQENVERRRVEQVLRVSEEQYRMLAENVKDGIVIVQNGKVVFANRAFTAMSGDPLEQLVMTNPIHLFHERTMQTARAQLTADTREQPASEWQAELSLPDGQTIWTEIQQTEIVWNGSPALLLTIRDITERKRQEQWLEQERARLKAENLHLKSTIKDRYRFGPLVGKSLAMQRVYELLVNAASAEVNVMICGESGTGKELMARTLHQVSRRRGQPFVPVNCASIPETLFEREFFGHRKGAFTGADRNTPGLFDRAHQGILFLDEVTELSPGTQAKLLRVLQDGEYTPLGSTTLRKADVLIVAATNQNCQQEIAQERLRKDFFYRIGVVEIAVPPLRDRKEDLPLLIEHILDEYRQKQAQVGPRGIPSAELPTDQSMLPPELVQALYAYDWPGNVRELQNVLQRYLVTRDLESVLPLLGASENARTTVSCAENLPPTLPEAVRVLEKRMITRMLTQTRHRIGKTAEQLGMPVRTLQYKIKKYQLHQGRD
jgi:PAS domain S-box-containing protein